MHLAEGAETRRNYRKPKAFGCSSVPLNFDSFLPLGVFFNSLSHGGTEEHGDTEERQKPIGKTWKDRRVAVSP
jgi:hypothetical protein